MTASDTLVPVTSLIRGVRRFLDLPPCSRRLLIAAGAFLIAVRAALVLLSYRTVSRGLKVVAARNNSTSVDRRRPTAEQLAWAVTTAARVAPDARCLTQALVLHGLMIHYRYPSCLRIGFSRDQRGRLEGHAWIEHGGKVILGGAEAGSRFQPVVSMDDKGLHDAGPHNDKRQGVDRDTCLTHT